MQRLPSICIDHLGLSGDGFHNLLELVASGARVKASGFGRVDLPVTDAIRSIVGVNPAALLFGTDLPSTRARRAFSPSDIDLVCQALDEDASIDRVLRTNAQSFYMVESAPSIVARRHSS